MATTTTSMPTTVTAVTTASTTTYRPIRSVPSTVIPTPSRSTLSESLSRSRRHSAYRLAKSIVQAYTTGRLDLDELVTTIADAIVREEEGELEMGMEEERLG